MATVLRLKVQRTSDSLAAEEILRAATIIGLALALRALIGLF